MKQQTKCALIYSALILLTTGCGPNTTKEKVQSEQKPVSTTSAEVKTEVEANSNQSQDKKETQSEQPASEFDSAPGWVARTDVDEMTDKKVYSATIRSVQSEAVWLKTINPILAVRCSNKKLEVFIHNDTSAQPELGNYDKATVTVRFDEKKARKILTSESTDNDALFFPNSKEMLKQIVKSDLMLYQFTPFNRPPTNFKFAIKNTKDSALAEILENCKV